MIEMSQKRYEELADALLDRAKLIRARYRYSEDEKMAQCAGIISQTGQSGMIPMLWKNNDEKEAMMRALCITAKEVDAFAVFLISDSRWVTSNAFCQHFNIPNPRTAAIDTFQSRYREIMKGYDYQIKNLPRKLWTEAVVVALKGPGITPIMKLASYIEGRKDTVEWLAPGPPIKGDEMQVQINMLPDWWTVQ